MSSLWLCVKKQKTHKKLTISILYKTLKQTCKAAIPLQVSFMVFFLLNTALFAQRPPAGVGGNSSRIPDPSQLDTIPQEEGELEIDTANIAYFFADNPGRFYVEKDSLLDNFFQQYDPARRRLLDYYHLGYAATASYPSVYQPSLRRGLDIGLHAFDIYQLKNADIRFFQQTKPFADISTAINGQNNGGINARFSRNFADGVNFSAELRILPCGRRHRTQLDRQFPGGSSARSYRPRCRRVDYRAAC